VIRRQSEPSAGTGLTHFARPVWGFCIPLSSLRRRAARRAGELLKVMEKAKGGDPTGANAYVAADRNGVSQLRTSLQASRTRSRLRGSRAARRFQNAPQRPAPETSPKSASTFRHERAGPHGDDNQIAQIGAPALISSEIVKGATLKD
jgi:hypothetical protein